MKIVQINTTCGVGSTGKICVGISKILTEKNIENYILFSAKTSGYQSGIQCSSVRNIKMQALKSKLFGNYGFNSKKSTKKIISELDKINPDIVHLHNIHGHDCNLEILFSYFKKKKTRLIWTFHDCWAFTAYCPHFLMAQCDKWQTKCFNCKQRREYSWFFDKSSKFFQKKKDLFQGIDLTIVTPSIWLADMTKKSFFKDYDYTVQVINNGIDLRVFKPVENDFRKKYKLDNKKIILGVSFEWSKRKGLDVFIDLARRLSDDYKIVLVGTNDKIDKQLPNNILAIQRTQNQYELAEIYSTSNVFVNPTREENYPTVHLEAIACGLPVITFCIGGCCEMIDETCASIVKCNDIDTLEKEIIRICTEKPYTKEACLKKAIRFDEKERFKDYLDLYEAIYSKRN